MDIHFISIAATQDIYLDIWRNMLSFRFVDKSVKNKSIH